MASSAGFFVTQKSLIQKKRLQPPYESGVHSTENNGVFTPEQDNGQDNDKTNVEPVHSYNAFHTRHVGPGVKCTGSTFVLSLSCSGVKTPLDYLKK